MRIDSKGPAEEEAKGAGVGGAEGRRPARSETVGDSDHLERRGRNRGGERGNQRCPGRGSPLESGRSSLNRKRLQQLHCGRTRSRSPAAVMALVPAPDRNGGGIDLPHVEMSQPQTKTGDVDQGVGPGELVKTNFSPMGAVDLGLRLGEPFEDSQNHGL